MLKISFTHQYMKDLELMQHRNLPKSELDEVVKLLSEEQPLLQKHKDHALFAPAHIPICFSQVVKRHL
jgi:mRNA-degrading endonuclease YafQ of YafQ-DinJ toxin-antitoxin module